MRFAFFDLDDTLVDSKTALRAWSADFAADHVPGGLATAGDVFSRVTAAESWQAFVADIRGRYAISAPDEQLMAHVAENYPNKFVLDPRVRDGLVELRDAGWLLGIVTNGTTLVQQAKVDSVGLRPHVDVVVDSEAAGSRKPERRIFEIAAGQLGVDLESAGWMVGDRLDKDVAGGQAAGLRTIWIADADNQSHADSAPSPTRTTGSILDAFRIVLESAR